MLARQKERYHREVLDPETGKVVKAGKMLDENRKQFNKCSYEGCGKGFKCPSDLARHVRTHTRELPFQCTECGKRCNTKWQLIAHQRCHSDEANFPCKYCDKSYKNPGGLKKHLTEGRGCEGLKRLQAMGLRG